MLYLRRTTGSSLISAVVGLGIVSLAIFASLRTITVISKTQQSLQASYDISDVRRGLMNRIDCLNSLRAHLDQRQRVVCPNKLRLRDRDNTLIADDDGESIGNGWFARATCHSDGIDVSLRKARGGQVVSVLVLGALDYSANFNPVIGRDTAYRVCSEYFGVRPQAAYLTTEIATTPEFASFSYPQLCNATISPSEAEKQSTNPTMNRADRACASYCSNTTNRFRTGFMTGCGAGGLVGCSCIR